MTHTISSGTQQAGLLVRKARLRLANVLLPKEHEVHLSDGTEEQGHLTISFPMKSRAASAAVRDHLAAAQTALYDAADAVGTLHYCRFISVDDEAVYLLADYDGRFDNVLEDLARHLGPILDPILRHVSDPPPTPVASNGKAFVDWARAHSIKPFAEYSAYPEATTRQIRSQAAEAGVELELAGAKQLPLLVIMPMKGRVSIVAVSTVFQLLMGYLKKGGDAVGTVHFAHLVKLPHNQVGFFTLYDGPFDKYTQDFADQLGPAFDLLFRFTKNPPPTPTSKHAGTFSTWVKEHDLKPLAFYSGYPGLQVQDVKALVGAPVGASTSQR